MTIEHRDIQEAGLHEPKGVSTATLGQAYIADGSGSGNWTTAALNPNNLIVERLVDGVSLATSQEPVGTDAPLQLEFGAAVGTVSDPVMLAADGTLTINSTGTYRIKVSTAAGRTGGVDVFCG